MAKLLLIFLCSGVWLIAGDLQQSLLEQLHTGKTEYNHVAVALIGEGIDDPDKLKDYLERYEQLQQEVALSDKQARGNEKKQAKNLYKNVTKTLAQGADGDGFLDLIDNRAGTLLTTTYVLADAASRANLLDADWAAEKARLDAWFIAGIPSFQELIASHLIAFAEFHAADQPELAGTALRISTQVFPKTEYGVGSLDVKLYNHAFNLFENARFEDAARLLVGAARRYPAQNAFHALSFNTGIKLLGSNNADSVEVTELAAGLMPLMGEHQADFENALDTHQYNLAAALYNNKDYERAMVQLEKVNHPPAGSNYKNVLSSTYALLAEQYLLAGDTEKGAAVVAKLEGHDPASAEILAQRLKQLELKAKVESGDLEQALTDAAVNLGSELDRKNYYSVLTQYVQGLRNQGNYEEALAVLDAVPAAAQLGSLANDLRYNTYSTWINSFPPEQDDQNYMTLIGLYQRIFGDKKLTLGDADAALFRENYGKMLYREIEQLVADRHFKKADKRSREALALVPDYQPLKEQRKLVDTILQRIK